MIGPAGYLHDLEPYGIRVVVGQHGRLLPHDVGVVRLLDSWCR